MKAIRVHRHGGPDVLVYFRTGEYAPPALPFPGNEGAGEVVAVGEGVEDFAPGDRVAYVETLGSRGTHRASPLRRASTHRDRLRDRRRDDVEGPDTEGVR
jgi:NADPH:quinone reductase